MKFTVKLTMNPTKITSTSRLTNIIIDKAPEPIKNIFLRREAFKELCNLTYAYNTLSFELNEFYKGENFDFALVFKLLEVLNNPLKYYHSISGLEVAKTIFDNYKRLLNFYKLFEENPDKKVLYIKYAYKNLHFCNIVYKNMKYMGVLEDKEKLREDIKKLYEESLKTLNEGTVILNETNLTSEEIAELEEILARPIPMLED